MPVKFWGARLLTKITCNCDVGIGGNAAAMTEGWQMLAQSSTARFEP